MSQTFIKGRRLSPQQRHLRSLQADEVVTTYCVQCSVLIDGRLDVAALRSASKRLYERHEILRTEFQQLPGAGWTSQVVPNDERRPRHAMPEYDFRELSAPEQRARIAELLGDMRRRLPGPRHGAALDSTLLRLGAERWALLVGVPAVYSDAAGLGNIVGELVQLYGEEVEGRTPTSARAPIQYADVSEVLNDLLEGDDVEAGRDYWNRPEVLKAAEAVGLGIERPAPEGEGEGAGFVPRATRQRLDRRLAARVDELAGLYGVGPEVLMLSCWQVLLWRLTGRPVVSVGTSFENRNFDGLQDVIGPFVKYLPLDFHLSKDLIFEEVVRRTAESVGVAREWQDYFSWEQLADSHGHAGSPLFCQFAFDYERAPAARRAAGLSFSVQNQYSCTDRYGVKLSCLRGADDDADLALSLHYDAARFAPEDIERLAREYVTLLGSATRAPESKIHKLPLLTEGERRRLLDGFEPEPHVATRPRCLHEAFEEQVASRPSALAVTCEGRSLTYAELDAAAERVATRLRPLGVGPERLVGIFLGRSERLVVAILGVLKAGGAYVPLDANYPAARLFSTLDDAGSAVLITEGEMAAKLPEPLPARLVDVLLLDVLLLDAGREEAPAGPHAEGARAAVSPDNLAYVIYTSGSTGKPKGALVTHGNVWRLFTTASRHFRLSPSDCWTMFHSPAFDFSVWELWGALLHGGRLVVVPYWVSRSPDAMLRLLSDEGVTVLSQTPSAFRQLMAEDERAWGEARARAAAGEGAGEGEGEGEGIGLDQLREVVFGGEALEAASLRGWVSRRGVARPRLINMYGITETTVHVTYSEVTEDEVMGRRRGGRIGGPLADLRLYVLDGWGEVVAEGVAGELYVGGAGLARGYLNRPSLTAERFVPDPFSTEPGSRLYRTGDVVRRLSGGELEYVGRIDEQVKVRGFRIEPGEIESAISSHASVREAVVSAREDEPGDRRLVAYVVGREGEVCEASELRRHLKGRLPDYMVPSAFVTLDSLPLTPSGKVDRRALPAPESGRGAIGEGYVAARTPVEEVLCGIFAEVLGVGEVGVRDNFFELGGHSLLATQVVSRVRGAFGVELPLRALFESPTVEGLASQVEASRRGEGSAAPALEVVARDGELPLSFAQQRLWFLDQLEPGSSEYNLPGALRLSGRLDVAALESSISEVVRRHEAMRTTFAVVDGEPVQVIAPHRPVALPLADLSALAEDEREAEAARLLDAEAQRRFDLSEGPLVRARLLRLGAEEHVLLFTMHHIISDGWSVGVLIREVTALYEAFSQRLASPLPELEIQYADFAVWQRRWLQGEALDAQLSYWKRQLAGSPPVLELPTDRPHSTVTSADGATESLELSESLTERLRALSRREGATLFMTLLATFQTLLARYSGQTDVVVGTPIANRNRSETESLIGFFVNTLVMRTDLSGDPTFAELLRRVREVSLGAYAHQDVPFERLVEELQPERSLQLTPLFQVMFILQNTPQGELTAPGLRFDTYEVRSAATKFELTLAMSEADGRLRCGVEYRTGLFDATTVGRMLRHFETLLEAVAADPALRLSELPLLGADERAQILSAWNDTRRPYPDALCIHELFEAQVERTPEASAVVYEGEELTFGELNRRANRVARRLRAHGVGPDVPVGICVERSNEMVVGLLGILKAGGAYVPLDPEYPRERLSFMLKDADVKVLVAQERTLSNLPEHDAEVVRLDTDREELDALGDDNLDGGASPDNLAYVIYTSGSTGTPKGVLGLHRGAVNRFAWMWAEYPFAADEVCCQKTSLNFLDSLWEIFGPLLRGVPVVIIPAASVKDPPQLMRALAERRVSRIVLVPSLLRHMLGASDDPQALLPDLKIWVTSGEAISADLTRRFRELMPRSVLLNLYGSSEISADVTAFDTALLGEELQNVPIGRPIANTQIYVLDARLSPVPIGVVGEVYSGGDGLGRGYWRRPDLTAERFIPDPFGPLPGGRLYATGDLARFLPDGNVEYLGRRDFQVKVRGFRIELGEVEAALVEHPAVSQAVVMAEGETGDSRLFAYLVGDAGTTLSATELRNFLKERLPDYMLPSVFVVLDELPLTPNGKVDRRALSAAKQTRLGAGAEYAAPRTPTEEILAGVWAALLGVERVGAHDNFFELGGHSLLATRVVSRVRELFRVELPLRSLFEVPTVAGLAAGVEQALKAGGGLQTPPIAPAPREGHLPLSFAQQQLWVVDQLESGSAFYNVPVATRLKGPLDASALTRAFDELVRRHETLRTRFETVDGRPAQIISEPESLHVEVEDLTVLPEQAREDEARRLAREEARTPFDLSTGPLVRVRVLRLDDEDHVVLLTMHHIVSDGWSMGVLVNEMAALYEAFSQGQASPLPALSIQYADFAVWQREWLQGEALERQLSYWRERLTGAPPLLELPTDFPRPAVQTYEGARLTAVFPLELADSLDALNRREGVTLFMTTLAAYNVLLHYLTGQEDVVVGTDVANRNRAETESLIGFFVNQLVMRTDLSGDPTFAELLRRVREVSLGAYAHQDLPFDRVLDALKPERNTAYSPLFQAKFTLQNTSLMNTGLTNLNLSQLDIDGGTAKFDLLLNAYDSGDGLVVWFEYRTSLFTAETIARMLRHVETILRNVAHDPGINLGALVALLAEDDERRRAAVEQELEESAFRKLKFATRRPVRTSFEAQIPDGMKLESTEPTASD